MGARAPLRAQLHLPMRESEVNCVSEASPVSKWAKYFTDKLAIA